MTNPGPSESAPRNPPRRRRMTFPQKCPRCKSTWIKRSHSKAWERIVLFVLRARVYRCSDCHRRFWTSDIGRTGVFVLGTLGSILVLLVIFVSALAVRSGMQSSSKLNGAALPAAVPSPPSADTPESTALPRYYYAVPVPQRARRQTAAPSAPAPDQK
jgi:hypothetical protein